MRFLLLCCLVAPGLAAAAPLCAVYSCSGVTVTPAGSTWTNGLNAAGTLAGFAETPGVRGYTLQPGGNAAFFDAPGSSGTYAYGINGAGTVSGNFVDSAGDHGFVGNTVFNVPGAFATYGFGIDNSGAVAGFHTDIAGGAGSGFVRASDGSFSTFQVGGQPTYAYGIANGAVVGTYVDAVAGALGFIRSGSSVTTYQVAGAQATYLRGINSFGDLVGSYVDALGRTRGFAQLDGVFWSVDIAGADGTVAAGVNDLRQVVGYSTTGADTTGFLAMPQPISLPASFTLFMSALLWLRRLA